MNLAHFFKTKQEYREYAKQTRTKIDLKRISEQICQNLKEQDFYKSAKNILGYFPLKTEIDIRELFKDETKHWSLPKVKSDKTLLIYPYKDGDVLAKNKYEVCEPINSLVIDPKDIDIAIIPALMADMNGYRLGYGAGYYDRFIPLLRGDCIKITLIPDELVINSLPHDEWDMPVDKIITNMP